MELAGLPRDSAIFGLRVLNPLLEFMATEGRKAPNVGRQRQAKSKSGRARISAAFVKGRSQLTKRQDLGCGRRRMCNQLRGMSVLKASPGESFRTYRPFCSCHARLQPRSRDAGRQRFCVLATSDYRSAPVTTAGRGWYL